VRVAALDELEREGVRVVRAGRAAIAVFCHEGKVSALDNRCPHLGFPLHRGTVRDGVLTCHWHHAKFDLAGGCTFDPFADDAVPYPVEVVDGVVWLDPQPFPRDVRAHHLRKLDEGLEHALELVLAKSVLGLSEVAEPEEVLARAATFAVRNRAAGWSAGLSILTALAGVLDVLDAADRPAALFHGVVHVARHTAGQPPSFDLAPLDTGERRPERLTAWFRRFCEVRSDGAAERTLRAATHVGLPRSDVAGMVLAACTDHRFLDEGHALDFANKAFELLDRIGWDHADEVLPALVPAITGGRRMEETSAWRHPVDLAALVDEAFARLEAQSRAAEDSRPPVAWDGHAELAGLVLDGEPQDALGRIVELLGAGVAPSAVSTAVAYAAAMRLVHFPTSNEEADWDTVHHVFTYANAVDQALRRAPSPLVLRGLLDAAAAVHLERFLNVPKRPVPIGGAASREPAELLDLLDRHGHVDEAAQATADLLAAGRDRDVVRTLGHALLREDAGFHSYQVFEAGLRQHANLAGRPEAAHVLVGVARFLAARFPTVRSRARTWTVATRLHRGEAVHADLDEP
jgi:nitrite reductase/ring-hydroxylating ferredoxin subunit